MEDLQSASKLLSKAMKIRERYMKMSRQKFPTLVESYLKGAKGFPEEVHIEPEKATLEDTPIHPPKSNDNPWDCAFLPNLEECVIRPVQGVFQVYRNSADADAGKIAEGYDYPDLDTYVSDMHLMCALIVDGPLKSFCYRRLTYLSSKFNLHQVMNESKELAAQKAVAHRDFYNVRKVDTHIHAASCMTQKHLLRFMKKAMKTEADTPVCLSKDGKPMTMNELFKSMNVTSHDLSIDLLDVHADRDTFQRFDKFNAKFNPIGENRLREVFVKTDNYVEGTFFGRIIKEVMCDLEEDKYQFLELRISIYGRSLSEWDNLADWAINNNIYSDNVRWLIQVPRLYDVYKRNKELENFFQMIDNIFHPLFEVTKDPSTHPSLHRFLQ